MRLRLMLAAAAIFVGGAVTGLAIVVTNDAPIITQVAVVVLCSVVSAVVFLSIWGGGRE